MFFFRNTRILTQVFMATSIFLFSLESGAQDAQDDSRASTELGVHSGPLLPSRISGVREIVPGWGLRASFPTGRGVFETDSFFGRGSGIEFNSLALDYRLDVANSYLPVHFLLGLHVDQYKGVGKPWTVASGWHYGGGTSLKIAGPLSMRVDFKSRFGPGDSLYVGVGFVYRLPSSGNGAP
jgi:hypothetical protein